MQEKSLYESRQFRRLYWLASVGETALHQFGSTIADHGANIRQGDSGSSLFGEYGVERAVKIWRAVDERSVEIENQDVAFANHDATRLWWLPSGAP